MNTQEKRQWLAAAGGIDISEVVLFAEQAKTAHESREGGGGEVKEKEKVHESTGKAGTRRWRVRKKRIK